jgi:hypothetical protein
VTHDWDEFSKALAEPVPRRESLRRLGAVMAGAVLGPLGAARAAPRGRDPCKAFCKCRNKAQQNACLAACKACSGDTRRLCGSCGSYACCGTGQACCGGHCTDLARDVSNCGACGYACAPPGPYEYGACVDGRCVYACVEGAVRCNGTCTSLGWDPDNCGACGNVCPAEAPYCNEGVCFDPGCAPGLTWCDPGCVDLLNDPYNCGACYNQCAPSEVCAGGICFGPCVGCE